MHTKCKSVCGKIRLKELWSETRFIIVYSPHRILGNKLTDEKKSSKAFLKFEHYLFGKDNLEKSLFTMIDPSTMDGLSDEEKILSEGMLKAALSKKFDRRWLWGLGDLKTESAYQFLLDLFNKETVAYSKVRYASTLILMNTDAPVLEYIQGILDSEETDETRAKAVSALYWLYDKKFEDDKRHQLFLTILFDAMLNKTNDIRCHSYGILKDHYGMNEFTPLHDPVMDILLLQHKTDEYPRAVKLFKERIESIEVSEISDKLISKWITDLPNNPPTMKITDCEICSEIPNKVDADIAANESLDKYTSKLETAVRFAYYKNSVMRCPLCGMLYIYKYEYEYLVHNSEEDEYLWRSDTEGAIELVKSFMKYYDFKHVVTCGTLLKLVY